MKARAFKDIKLSILTDKIQCTLKKSNKIPNLLRVLEFNHQSRSLITL